VSRILWLLTLGAYGVLALRAAAGLHPWPAALFGALYAVVAILGYAWVQRRALPWRSAYVLVQLVLGFVVFATADASVGATLLLIVLVVQSVLLLPLPGAIAITVAVPFVHVGMAWDAGIREGLGTLIAVIFAAVVTWLLRREQQTRQMLATANEQLTRLAAQAEELATTHERNRVARDIHDGLGHYLTVLQMQVRASRAMLARDVGRADELLAQAEGQALAALSEVRRSVAALRGPRHDESLADVVARLATEASVSGPRTSVEVKGEPRGLPPAVEEALYRAAQEGLTNIRKHAQATRAHVLLDYRTSEQVRVVVGDDGCGDAPGAAGGFGLTGLRERLADLGGGVALESVPGRGSTLTATAPG
jgi:signal transduction histidine kinase